MSTDRVTSSIRDILDGIIDGTFSDKNPLPPEAELAQYLDVSRPTMREAVRSLSTGGVLNVVHGRGTYVNPMDQWHDMSVIAYVLTKTRTALELGSQLTMLRHMIEVPAAELAARNRTRPQLAVMSEALDRFDEAVEANNTDAIAQADIDFHDAILQASGNPFISAILHPLRGALAKSRVDTTEVVEVRDRAREHHWAIFAAIKNHDHQAAHEAMAAHIVQTMDDIKSSLD